MKIYLHFENVGIGDCLLLYLNSEDDTYKMLIDCGKYNSSIKKLFEVDYKIKHIDKLIITHFDNDHIIGVIELLKALPDLKINDIWFNCYRHLPKGEEIQLTDFQRKKIEELYQHLNSTNHLIEHDISAENALSLSNILANNSEWLKVWNTLSISLNEKKEYDLGKWGNIRLLSPTTIELEQLEKVFKVEFCKKLYGKAETTSFEKNNEIYELLLRTIDDNTNELPDNEFSISTKLLLNKQLIQAYSREISPIDNTETNRSSIAFIWSINNHSILFLGDSAPDVILEQIREYKLEKGLAEKVLYFDAIKVSHHGSKRNISSELLKEIDSMNFIFCGRSEKRPDEICISKIINRSLPEGIAVRNLIFNNENEVIRNFNRNINIQQELNFTISINTFIEFDWE